MKLRIACVLYNSGEHIEDLLDSIKDNVKVDAEILFWDNGKDRSNVCRYILANTDYPFKIHIFGDGENLGFSKAVNAATKQYTGFNHDFVLLINPDTLICSQVNDDILKEAQLKDGLYGLRVFNDPSKAQRQASARSFPSLLTSITGREGLLTKLYPNNPWSKKYLGLTLSDNQTSKVDWASGSALLFTPYVWENLSGFDENYFLYCEDVDLGKKAQQLGIPIFYFPKIDIAHHIRGSSKRTSYIADFHHHNGMWTFYTKWSGNEKYILAPFIFTSICLRYLFRRVIK